MRAGRLRHTVAIQQPVETQNDFGEPEITWSNVATGIWAGIEPLSGREFFESQHFNAEINVRVVMRYRNDITAKMRILHGDDEYYVDTVINFDGRNRELRLMCTRSVD